LTELYKAPDLVVDINSKRQEWLGHVTGMDQRRVVKKIFDSKPEGRRKVGRPRLRWLDDVENDLRVTKIKRWKKRLKIEKNGHPSLRRPRFLKDRRAKEQAREGCSLLPSLFNIYIYIDDLIKKWKEQIKTGIKLKQRQYTNTLLFADDQILIQDREDNLQQYVYTLHNLSKEYNLKTSIQKTKVMAFKGKFPIITKIITDNNILEEVSHFNYWDNEITYMQEKDMHNKLNKFCSVRGTLGRTSKTKTRKTNQITFYKVMALPVQLYGSETWTIKTKDMSKIQATEMRYVNSVKGCTKLDHITNEDIRKELDIDSTQYKIENYRKKWIEH
jgi:hypothetical protein